MIDADDKRANMTPRELVAELDKHIIGQANAKRSVAIAMRNRWRRHRLPANLREEVMPKNILMVGPTGSGKTEIARRLAKLTNAPFVKVEATKFTEVGFHGRDVDSIIRDLVRSSIALTRQRRRRENKEKIGALVDERILDALLGKPSPDAVLGNSPSDVKFREDMRQQLRGGALDSTMISVELPIKEQEPQMGGAMKFLFVTSSRPGRKTEHREMPISEARPLLEEQEAEKLFSGDDVVREAIRHAESDGIVFLDEIDKIVSDKSGSFGRSADASAEGVQRDLLPLIEGSTVSTKYGNVNTDHILFIASGAFHSVKPSDMLAELQGRLPIRVELKALTEQDFFRILTETENNLIKQQAALLKAENVDLEFTPDAIREVARVAYELNNSVENIGARRLHAVIERIVEEISFEAADMPAGSKITVDVQIVKTRVGELLKKTDLTRYIL